jgi:hypothetical protein
LLSGLIQTEKYVEAIIRKLADPTTSEDLIQTKIEIRLARQQLLEQSSPPNLICVLDEAAVRRTIGERDVARGQLDHLISLSTRSNITIEMVPFSAGLHGGMLESFHILEFPEPEDGDVLFVETSRDVIVSHDQAGAISSYFETFENLRNISLGPDGTIAYLEDIARELA